MPNHVKTPTGETHYYATPEETPAKMADLVAWLRDHQQKEDLHPLIIAAIFHYRFVAIHPFDDGNGRMSRLLMNLLLMQDAYPPVVIRQQARKEYYYALRQADAGDLEPFVTFIGENLLHSMDLYLRGARGESIEDQDDLDKEIALLKAGLPKDVVVKDMKSAELVKANFDRIVIPFFNALYERSLPLHELFLEFKTEVLTMGSNGSMNSYNLNDLLHGGLLENRQLWNEILSLSLSLSWRGFNRNRNAFNLNRQVEINFNEFDFTVFEMPAHQNGLKINVLYGESVAEHEIKSWSDTIIRGILAEIKSKTT